MKGDKLQRLRRVKISVFREVMLCSFVDFTNISEGSVAFFFRIYLLSGR